MRKSQEVMCACLSFISIFVMQLWLKDQTTIMLWPSSGIDYIY